MTAVLTAPPVPVPTPAAQPKFEVLKKEIIVEIPQTLSPSQLTGIWTMRGKDATRLRQIQSVNLGRRIVRIVRITSSTETRQVTAYRKEHHPDWRFADIGDMYGCARHRHIGYEIGFDRKHVFLGSHGVDEDTVTLVPCLELKPESEGSHVFSFQRDETDFEWQEGTQFMLSMEN